MTNRVGGRSPGRRQRASGVIIAALLVTASCGGDARVGRQTGDTVSVGRMPGSIPVGTLASGAVVPAPESLVGERAEGNRLILIGDSILAGTSTRYGGEACTTLVPLGWQVAVEAEVGRPISFGHRVLDERPPDEWDAAVIFLGTNYGGDEVRYESELDLILDRLSPRPVILVTVTNHTELQREVNAVIESEVLGRDNVDVFDWTTASELPGVLSGDGIHPTDDGRQLLVDGLAELLGRAPYVSGAPGRCLPSELTDDSSGPSVSMPRTTRPAGGSATTTPGSPVTDVPGDTTVPGTPGTPTTPPGTPPATVTPPVVTNPPSEPVTTPAPAMTP